MHSLHGGRDIGPDGFEVEGKRSSTRDVNVAIVNQDRGIVSD
jgi:hypothetical protein